VSLFTGGLSLGDVATSKQQKQRLETMDMPLYAVHKVMLSLQKKKGFATGQCLMQVKSTELKTKGANL